ncbi:50S ribosomal protein L11 methyltransferase [uncultured Mailhella sp.]|uniref:50S ribosomal protein L11 methyltransferase n=1 Tax=uncultured Mailhella sp. TaxID=1981031 RepID=UPI00262F54FE|nr:50S ribosomal protein L11 methyltransferase [uncultured Mailhella sp.]
MPRLYRLDIVVTEEDFPLAEALVSSVADAGWEEESLTSGETLLRFTTEREQLRDELAVRISQVLPQAGLSRKVLPDQDWLAGWRRFFTPVEAGDFLVLPPWMKDQDPGARTPLVIEPKSAFGTGHHPTTTMCLEAISRLRLTGRLRAGQSFLDLGTGTGILGIACVKLGLHGLGADIDPLSVSNALENSALNGVDPEAFEIREGSVELAQERTFDVVIANILAGPLQEMAPRLLAALRPGGCLIVSGFLAVQVPGMLEAYRGMGEPARLIVRSSAADPTRSASAERPDADDWVCFFWPKV